MTVPCIGKRMAEAGHLAAELRFLAVEAKDGEDASAEHVLLQSADLLDMIATSTRCPVCNLLLADPPNPPLEG